MAKAKLVAADAGTSADAAASDAAPAMTPATKPAGKRGRPANKTKAGGGKKVAAHVDEDEEDGDDGLDEPTPKRGKSIIAKQVSADDSF